jgi:NAD(P)-dependent dehydrogenase (short-subunit alcohol dehydrogenase family)
LTLALAEAGADVVVHYRASEDEAVAVAAEVAERGRRAWTVGADLSAPGGCEELAAEAVRLAGPVQVLVNSASAFVRGTLEELTPEALAASVQLHALAPLTLTRALVGALPAGEPARVVNLLDAYLGTYQRTHVAYNLGKRVLLSLTRMMALEYAPRVTVNVVSPGLILPPAEGDSEGQVVARAAALPLQRTGTPQDITCAVLWLLEAGYVTGQVIAVDGGASLVTPVV